MMNNEHHKPVAEGMPRLAHELNNILMIIAGYADVLIAEHPDGPFVGDLQEIRRAAKRAVRLTSEFASPAGRVRAAGGFGPANLNCGMTVRKAD